MSSHEDDRVAGPPSELATTVLSMMREHANAMLNASPTNGPYAQNVLDRTDIVEAMLAYSEGKVEGVVSTWFREFKPIAETLFGVTIAEGGAMSLSDTFKEYSPTLLPGIYGRIRRVSLDETWGPLLALDLSTSTN